MAHRKYKRTIYKKKKKVLSRLFKVFGGIILLFFVLGIGVFVMFFKDLPRPEKFAEGFIVQSTKIYDHTGEVLLYELAGEEKRTIVPLAAVPEYLKQAVIVTEDRNFYQHRGIDLKAIGRALVYDLKIGEPAQGASTISQQLIRSYFLTRKKTLQRKTREIILALELERRYSKEQILEWYLNLIPFGSNLYGVEAASQAFFKKSVSALSLTQAAILASMIKAPSLLWPYGPNLEELLARKDFILENMAKAGFITKEEKEKALQEKIVFSKNLNPIRAPHFVFYVKMALEREYGLNYLTRAGLKIITTLDIELQEKAEILVKENIDQLAGVYQAYNGALVAINPKTGELLAMVGSKDYSGEPFPENCTPGKNCQFDPEVNVALASRQPGSALKPFVYAVAFQKGFTPDTLIWDVPTEFNPNCPASVEFEKEIEEKQKDRYGLECYHPKNYDGKFKGLLNLRSALGESRNLPSVKVLYLAGLKESLRLAQGLGITTLKDENRYGLSLVLGGGEVELLEMVSAYGVFANDGLKAPLSFIRKIEDGQGNILKENHKNSFRVVPAQTARQINDILADNEARAPVFGFNSPLYLKEYEAAAKTGTTQENRDAWCIGYTPSLVVGVWVGNSDNTPMTRAGGAIAAAPIWKNFMLFALSKLPQGVFEKPKEVVFASPKQMLDGTEPAEPHTILHFVNKNNLLGESPENPAQDPQYLHWEFAVLRFLGF